MISLRRLARFNALQHSIELLQQESCPTIAVFAVGSLSQPQVIVNAMRSWGARIHRTSPDQRPPGICSRRLSAFFHRAAQSTASGKRAQGKIFTVLKMPRAEAAPPRWPSIWPWLCKLHAATATPRSADVASRRSRCAAHELEALVHRGGRGSQLAPSGSHFDGRLHDPPRQRVAGRWVGSERARFLVSSRRRPSLPGCSTCWSATSAGRGGGCLHPRGCDRPAGEQPFAERIAGCPCRCSLAVECGSVMQQYLARGWWAGSGISAAGVEPFSADSGFYRDRC